MASDRATLTLKSGDKEVRYEAERQAVEAQLERIVDQILGGGPADARMADAGSRPEAETDAPAAGEKEPPDALPLGVPGPRADTWLCRDELERSRQVIREGQRRCFAIGAPPSGGPPDFRGRPASRLDGQATGQWLLAQLSK